MMLMNQCKRKAKSIHLISNLMINLYRREHQFITIGFQINLNNQCLQF